MRLKTMVVQVLLLSTIGPSDSPADTTFCTHRLALDEQGKLIPWYTPRAKAYDHFLRLRWNFIKTKVPVAPGPLPRSLYPQYYFYCAFRESQKILEPDTWMNDIGEKIPNWFESARLYYAYTGDSSVMKIVKDFMDYTLGHGTSPQTFAWPDFPYTTTNAGDTVFRGFTSAGRLALHEIQVDHAGEMGLTYYRMFLYTRNEKYLNAAIRVADVLAKNAKTGTSTESVWPYRVIMENGKVTAPYGANWTGCYLLLDNLIRAHLGDVSAYGIAREKARQFILQYPVKTGYWTDGHSDTDVKSDTYKSNLSASNATLCLFDHPGLDPDWKTDIPRLIKWTEDNFVFRGAPGEPSTMWGANIVGEQDSFMHKMDYQTARYAAACARWYAISGDASYKEKAFRSLNWVTYCNDSTGMAFESPVSKGILSWWSDCYGECPRMFYHAFAGVPEWAPPRENHILYSEGILKNVLYASDQIRYTATAENGTEYLRLAYKPLTVTLNGKAIPLSDALKTDAYTLKDLGNGDYAMVIERNKAGDVVISGAEISVRIDGAIRFQQMDGIGVNANTRSWEGDKLKPALNLLLDSMHFSIWRVVVETVEKWEDANDNDDPFSFNWGYYNQLYETPKFQKAWDMIRYLNDKGVKNHLMVNLMGRVPAWMGGDVITPEFEDEYIEMLVSFLLYAKNTRHLEIGLFGPMNEPDIRKEGPTVGPKQYAVLIRKLVDRMHASGLGEIKIVAPDVAGMGNGVKEYLPAIMADPVIMSNIAHIGLHSYGGYHAPVAGFLKQSAYPNASLWMTECNAWRNGLDDGLIGVYDYQYAGECVKYLIDLIKNGASACLLWEGYDSYYEHHVPSPFSYWGILGYDQTSGTYCPRKHFYAVSQVSKFIPVGSWRIGGFDTPEEMPITAFYDPGSHRITLVGINEKDTQVTLTGTLANLPGIENLEMVVTDSSENFCRNTDVRVTGKSFQAVVPSSCIFTITGIASVGQGALDAGKPEPKDWYAGDMHVHRNCGEPTAILAESQLPAMMEANDLAVVSVLADMGNGEAKDSKADLPKVNGTDAVQSKPGRTVHWDAEWHFDPAGVTFENKAIGGHLVLLGLREAHRVWDESPYKIIEWGKTQHAITGFCHMQYLNDSLPNGLDCCTPIDYPVEAALGTIDFLAEDVWLNDAAVNAYYKLLNCGFRLGWAAGTDYPCNNSQPFGSLLTYVQVRDLPFTYRKWIEGIQNGRTVVASNGHTEFLDLKVGENAASPGDEIKIKNSTALTIEVQWTSIVEQTGRIELVCNGKVIAGREGKASPGESVVLKTSQVFAGSSWICARRMDDKGHRSHTAPVYITVRNAPVRASVEDAQYFVRWIDNILVNIAPEGPWNRYFTHDLDVVQKRYRQARAVYEKIALEAKKAHLP